MFKAPVSRYRLILEGYTEYTFAWDKQKINNFLLNLTNTLNMHLLDNIYIWEIQPRGNNNKNQTSYTAYVPWLESGVQLHTWPEYDFITLDIFSCREFNIRDAIYLFIDTFNIIEINIDIPTFGDNKFSREGGHVTNDPCVFSG